MKVVTSLKIYNFNKSQILEKLLRIYNSGGAGLSIFGDPKIIYIHLSKCAGTTIHKTLLKNFNEIDNSKINFEELAENFDQYFSFTVVRNTYSKVLSQYNHEKNAKMHSHDLDSWLKIVSDKKIINGPNKDFSDYSNEYNELNQKIFCTIDGKNYLNYVGRFENIDETFKKLNDQFGIKNFPLLNPTIYRVNEINLKQTNLIKKIFKPDIEYFKFDTIQNIKKPLFQKLKIKIILFKKIKIIKKLKKIISTYFPSI